MQGFEYSEVLRRTTQLAEASTRTIAQGADVGKFAKLYNSKTWQGLREAQLNAEPLCRMCTAKGLVTPAEVVDHIKRHNGCFIAFTDPNNLQSLCKRHHDSDKQREEWEAMQPNMHKVDESGYPTTGKW